MKRFSVIVVACLAAALMLSGSANAALGGAPRTAATGDSLQSGLVGWWRLNGDFKDSSLTKANGTASGGPTTTADRSGVAGRAYNFDGTQFANLTNSTAFNSPNVTYSAWVKPTTTATNLQNIMAKEYQYKFRMNTTGLDVLVSASGTAWSNTLQWTNVFTAGVWTHVVVTIDSANSRVIPYVNGVALASKPITPITAYNTKSLCVADYNCAGGERLTGALDDLRFYNRVLSAGEVTALYGNGDPSSSLTVDTGKKGLVGQWQLDGNGVDSSPYGANAVLSNTSSTADRKGTANAASTFGATSMVSVPNSPQLNITGALTLSAWVRPTTLSGFFNNLETVVQKRTDSGGQPYALLLGNGGYLSASWKVSSGGDVNGYISTGTAAGVVPLNQWTHVAVTRDATSAVIYVNGVAVASNTLASTTAAPPIGNTNAVNIGGPTTQYPGFTGNIDDVRLYNRAQTATEVAAQVASYNSQINVGNLQKGLIGYWSFNGNAKDATPYANNGVNTGAAFISDRKGRSASAVQVGNTNQYVAVGSPSAFANLTSSGFTYSVWAMRTATNAYQWPQVMGAFDTHVGYGIRSESYGDTLSFEFATPPFDGAHYTNVGNLNYPINTWVMYTATFDGTTLRTYGNGAPLQAQAVTLNPTFQGLSFSRTPSGFEGSLDDARVYNRALSATEVAQLYAEYR